MDNTILSVSDFVALANQVLETALPIVVIEGEVSGYRVLKDKWIRFKLQDDICSVDFFGTVFDLKDPIEDGTFVYRISGKVSADY